MKLPLLALALSCALAACAGAPHRTATLPSATKAVTNIRFDARFGDAVARCSDSYANVGASKATVTLQDLRIYVSNVRLIARSGAEVPFPLTPDGQFQSDRVALLDFENATGNCNGNAAINTALRGVAPKGDFVGLAFDIGVPADLNHQDPTLAKPPLNFSALTWAWRYGFKFTTIDLETKSAAGSTPHPNAASGFSIHLGSVDCGSGSPRTPPETPCATPNRAAVRLDAFDPATQVIVLDLNVLLTGTDVTVNAPGTPSGCMSGSGDDDCVAIMDRLGLTFRGRAARGQSFARVETAQP